MNRGSFLKSLATLIAAPSVIAQIKEPVATTMWMDKAMWDFHKRWMNDAEKGLWYSKPLPTGTGLWEQMHNPNRYSFSKQRYLEPEENGNV